MSRNGNVLERYALTCIVLDALALTVVIITVEALHRNLPSGLPGLGDNYNAVSVYAIGLCCWLVSSFHFRLYEWRWTVEFRAELDRLIASVCGYSLLSAALLYFLSSNVPRTLFVYHAISIFLLVLIFRHVARSQIARYAKNDASIRVALIGGGRKLQSLMDRIDVTSNLWPSTIIIGRITTRSADDSAISTVTLGGIEELETVIAAHDITTVILAIPPEENMMALSVNQRLKSYAVDVRIVPDEAEFATDRATMDHVEGLPLVGLRDPALSFPDRLVKYSLDQLLSVAALILFAPLFLFIGLAIRLDSPGPALYRARRVGERGKLFTMYKFRSMKAGAELNLEQAIGARRLAQGIYKVPDDPRVTRVGRVLRRTSLDELPQLINVLRGEMSLVGPRPEQPFITDQYEPWQLRRLALRPGMTGWWQVNGRDEHPMHQYSNYDIYYLDNYSIWLDLLILARTIGAVVSGRGAY